MRVQQMPPQTVCFLFCFFFWPLFSPQTAARHWRQFEAAIRRTRFLLLVGRSVSLGPKAEPKEEPKQ